MPWWDLYWDEETEMYLALHGISRADFENAAFYPEGEDVSDSSGRPMRFGYAMDGRKIAIIYEVIDDITLLPVTAYEVK